MIIFRYDKTFEGLLSAIFEAYSRKTFPEKLLSENDILPLFATEEYTVITQDENSSRVWSSLEKKISKPACGMIWSTWLSELEGCDELIFRYICKLFNNKRSIESDFSDPDVLEMMQIARKVRNEAEHVRQFVRFQKASDDTFFAPISPIYNALPLAIDHFVDRFSDQKWLIYDMQRKYGFYYDLKTTQEITLDSEGSHLLTGKLDENMMAEDEKLFQQLWKNYFNALTIKERINPKLQRQHMPKRFWKYLTEKQ